MATAMAGVGRLQRIIKFAVSGSWKIRRIREWQLMGLVANSHSRPQAVRRRRRPNRLKAVIAKHYTTQAF